MTRSRQLRHIGSVRLPWWAPNWVGSLRVPADAEGWTMAVIAAMVALAGIAALIREVLQAWWTIPPLIIGGVWGTRKYLAHRWRYTHDRMRRLADFTATIEELDAADMRGDGLELAVVALLHRDGFTAERTGRPHDDGRDVHGCDPYQGLSWLFQVKHRVSDKNLGPAPIKQLNTDARDTFAVDVAVLVTNKNLTRGAYQKADDYGIHVIDRDRLIRWANDGETLHEVLGLKAGKVKGLGRRR